MTAERLQEIEADLHDHAPIVSELVGALREECAEVGRLQAWLENEDGAARHENELRLTAEKELVVVRERAERLERGIRNALGVIGENKVGRMRQRLEAVLAEQEKPKEGHG